MCASWSIFVARWSEGLIISPSLLSLALEYLDVEILQRESLDVKTLCVKMRP